MDWHGATVVTPNRAEAFLAAGIPVRDPNTIPPHDIELRRVGETLLKKWDTNYVLITLGEHGMMLFQQTKAPHNFQTKPRQAFKVPGAAETPVALFPLGLLCGAPPIKAVE